MYVKTLIQLLTWNIHLESNKDYYKYELDSMSFYVTDGIRTIRIHIGDVEYMCLQVNKNYSLKSEDVYYLPPRLER